MEEAELLGEGAEEGQGMMAEEGDIGNVQRDTMAVGPMGGRMPGGGGA